MVKAVNIGFEDLEDNEKYKLVYPLKNKVAQKCDEIIGDDFSDDSDNDEQVQEGRVLTVKGDRRPPRKGKCTFSFDSFQINKETSECKPLIYFHSYNQIFFT